jgi:hypothetical protein
LILELRDEIDVMRAEVEDQRASLAETVERLDFTERLLVQLRESATVSRESRD